ncbi:hypothetical protein F5148DRAFT_1153157 [Russula earlei]|uniref:Uncharacterized protein n=1 Tax=Russula earlei TaxID=71964 RepID=A0ACC0TVQ9_9AGAM|nr:hypothetical protein F5148DRAFT_1153157 [Russula earlei]
MPLWCLYPLVRKWLAIWTAIVPLYIYPQRSVNTTAISIPGSQPGNTGFSQYISYFGYPGYLYQRCLWRNIGVQATTGCGNQLRRNFFLFNSWIVHQECIYTGLYIL